MPKTNLTQVKTSDAWNKFNGKIRAKDKEPGLKEKITTYCSNVEEFFTNYVLCEVPEDVPVWVAGGALRDYFLYGYVKGGTDIDLFTNNQENFDKIRESLLEFYDEKYESKYALTFFDKEDNEKMVEISRVLHENPQECVGAFDFTACCAYVGRWPSTGSASGMAIGKVGHDAAEEFFEDCYNKKLRIIRLGDNPSETLKRIQTYIAKGFEFSNFEKISLVSNYLKGELQLEELVEEYEGLRLA